MPKTTPVAVSLEPALSVFYRYGLSAASDASLAEALSIPVAELHRLYPDRAALVHHTVLADIERQKREHTELYARYPSAVERCTAAATGLARLGHHSGQLLQRPSNHLPGDLGRCHGALGNVFGTSAAAVAQRRHPQPLFRSDININLVTKILMEQLSMMLNPAVFPPDRYNMAEVFRSIFLYYIRGICTDEGPASPPSTSHACRAICPAD
jgi:hypothetical protein